MLKFIFNQQHDTILYVDIFVYKTNNIISFLKAGFIYFVYMYR